MSDQLNSRNIQALAQAMRDLDARFSAQHEQLQTVLGQLAQLTQRQAVIDQQLAVQRVMGLGRGPTT